jgi:hypothetical protein
MVDPILNKVVILSAVPAIQLEQANSLALMTSKQLDVVAGGVT